MPRVRAGYVSRSRVLVKAALGCIALLELAAPAAAKPMHLRSFSEHYGGFLSGRLNQCGTCHQQSPAGKAPETLADFPHNAFGNRLAAVLPELQKAGKRADFGNRLRAVAGQDSDGDGASNQAEILSGHRPGDASDRPTAKELAGLPKLASRFAAYDAAYRWRPFEPVSRPQVPKVKNASWVRNPIDAFVAAEQEKRGLKPRPEASRAVLLRRVYLDVTGLSPTPAEIAQFMAECEAEDRASRTESRGAGGRSPASPHRAGELRPPTPRTAQPPHPRGKGASAVLTPHPSPLAPHPRANGAYERLVDRLLASPQYGERWGRHWMDVWRYSDWTGYGEQVRDSQPHIWRWRDWIVESLNRDKGYDRMLMEMLAADEAFPTDADALRGTGYLVRNYKLLSREKWMQDVVDHSAQAFLGLTAGCARCHDHMYDPVTQKEYYQLRAIFEPHQVRADWVPGEINTAKDGLPRAYDATLDAPTYLYVRGDEKQPVKEHPLAPGVPLALGGSLEVHPVELPLWAHVPEKQPYVIADLRAAATDRVVKAREVVEKGTPGQAELAQLRLDAAEASSAALDAVLRVEELEDSGRRVSEEWQQAATDAVIQQRRETYAAAALARAEAAQALARAEKAPGVKPETLAKPREALTAAAQAFAKAEAALKSEPNTAYKPRVTSNFPATSTGRRLAFANWLIAPRNPLTARTAVNHIWLRHFGTGLVPSAGDLGRAGVPPTHPALLDYLAHCFATGEGMSAKEVRGEQGDRVGVRVNSDGAALPNPNPNPNPNLPRGLAWSMKALHRLILTSATYRMASTPDPLNARIDPDNHYLWRMNSRRMDAELVRDNVLHVTGQLDLKMGGPEIDQNQGLSVKRRSLYFRHAPEKEMIFLNTFDGPSPLECYVRKQTVVPQQALALANSELTLVQSRLLARELTRRVGTNGDAFIAAVYERVLARSPSRAEMAECARFLQARGASGPPSSAAAAAAAASAVNMTAASDGGKSAADPVERAREMLVLVLLNHNDFITVR